MNDLSFKYFLSSSFDFSISRYLENVVFIHLRRMGYNIYTGNIKGKEIDFIAEKGTDKIYIQVTYLLSDEKVIEREFANFELINDNFEKIVVSLDDINFGNWNGIKHINAWEFIK